MSETQALSLFMPSRFTAAHFVTEATWLVVLCSMSGMLYLVESGGLTRSQSSQKATTK